MSIDAIVYVTDFTLPPMLKLALVEIANNYGFYPFSQGEACRLIESNLDCPPGMANHTVFQLITSGVIDRLTCPNKEEDTVLRLKSVRRPGPTKRIRRRAASKKGSPSNRQGFVYLLCNEVNPSIYKIGRTRNPKSRRETFGVLLPFDVEYVCLIQADDMYALERELHDRFADKRVNGEWFALSPDDVTHIKSMAVQHGRA